MRMQEHPAGRKAHDLFMAEQLFGSCMSREEVWAAFQQMNIPAEDRCFYVSILTPENLADCARRANSSRYELMHLAASEIGRCCGILSSEDLWMLSGMLPSEIAVLFSIRGEFYRRDRQALEQKVSGVLQEIMDSCGTSGITWRAYTSHPTLEAELISQTFDQARELMAAAVMLGLTAQNIRYEDLCVAGAELYTPDYMRTVQQQEGRFWTALSRNDFQKVQAVLHEMIAVQFRLEHLNVQCATAVFYALLNKVRCAIDCMRLVAGPEAFVAFETAPRILYRKSIREVEEQIDVIFDTFYHDKSNSASPPPWLSRLQEYIQGHYCDPNLNIATAADRFGLNPAYASRLYKRYFGHGILERINLLRIEEAKKQMQANRRLKDIAAAVGYDNPQRMNRAFQKYIGVTPREFMEQHQTLDF